MRNRYALWTAAAILIAASPILDGPAQGAGNPEAVEIAQQGLHLKAALYRPEGPGPFPAVVGLHNCTGLRNSAG